MSAVTSAWGRNTPNADIEKLRAQAHTSVYYYPNELRRFAKDFLELGAHLMGVSETLRWIHPVNANLEAVPADSELDMVRRQIDYVAGILSAQAGRILPMSTVAFSDSDDTLAQRETNFERGCVYHLGDEGFAVVDGLGEMVSGPYKTADEAADHLPKSPTVG